MRIIGITDIHERTGYFNEISSDLKRADLVLIAGDITHFGGNEQAQS